MRYITRTIWILSLVSLFTDMASELLYPVMPLYLKSIGFSVLLIGILEGIAEAAAGLSKGYFGQWSDQSGRRVPFVQLGYTLSAFAKPLLVLFNWPGWVVAMRTLDRAGKGIRTGARDAMLSGEATPQTKASVFGFHRAMDTLGAVLGPTFGLIYLYFNPGDYKPLFFYALIPGILAITATLSLNEKAASPQPISITFYSFIRYWKQSPPHYRRIVTGFLVFALVNSSDVFLLLQAKQRGLDEVDVIAIYIFYNLVYAVFSFPMGRLADRFGLKTIFVTGLLLFATVYAGLPMVESELWFLLLFFLYGLYAAATEGISKAWITNVAEGKDTATAIGTFSAFQSICAMVASLWTGLIWYLFGAAYAFAATAGITGIVILYFVTTPNEMTKGNNQ